MELKRGVPAPLLNALTQVSHPVIFTYIDWPDSPVHVHSAVGVLTWGEEDWNGVGIAGNIEIPAESSSVAAVEATLSLVGVPADLGGFADDQIRGREARIFVGALTDRPGGATGKESGTLVSDPVHLFSGLMDGLEMVASDAPEGVSHEVRVLIATGVEARSMASVSHSYDDQKRSYPSDTAGRHLLNARARAEKLTWPEN